MFKAPRPYFEGAPTTPEERAVLQNAGYVHITGLWCHTRDHGIREDGYYVGEKLFHSHLGTWHDYCEQSVIVTERGEVWLKSGSGVASVVHQFCPNGQSDYWPFGLVRHQPIAAITRRRIDPNDGLIYVP
ncbi:MAG: hypothetical protein WCW66_04475 [Patescibacteria group bacterium]